jgi:SAM-dependent methyltransferase
MTVATPEPPAMTESEIRSGVSQLIAQYGEWAYDIPLPHGVWTRGNEQLPHTRLRRILQTIADLTGKPLPECRILDLASLDGIFAIECALQGASVLGIEIREANVLKAQFAQKALGLTRLEFIQDDVRNVTRDKYGTFDAVICSGILYHLNIPDVFALLEHLHALTMRLLVVDTHIALQGSDTADYNGKTYYGRHWREHAEDDTDKLMASRLLASFGNRTSFQFTRPSLINFMAHIGFSSVYECFSPAHLNFGKSGLEHRDRCTFVAIKGTALPIQASPAVNSLHEDWPEDSLSYAAPVTDKPLRRLVGEVLRRLRMR